jgi:hypothetical protein
VIFDLRRNYGVHDSRHDTVLLELPKLLSQHLLRDARDRALQVREAKPIEQWKLEATAKYHYTSEPLSVDVWDPNVTVIARVTGEFPGSPVDLRYHFTLEGDKIARLEITT